MVGEVGEAMIRDVPTTLPRVRLVARLWRSLVSTVRYWNPWADPLAGPCARGHRICKKYARMASGDGTKLGYLTRIANWSRGERRTRGVRRDLW